MTKDMIYIKGDKFIAIPLMTKAFAELNLFQEIKNLRV